MELLSDSNSAPGYEKAVRIASANDYHPALPKIAGPVDNLNAGSYRNMVE